MAPKVADDDEPTAAKSSAERRRARDETRHVLREGSRAWTPFSCPGTAECCQLAVTRCPPWLWPSEWEVLEDALRRAGRPLPPARADGGCPFLDAQGKRCTVYESRPLGCRTFFCHRVTGPTRVPANETNALLDRLAALNLAVDPHARPRSLLEWWADAAR
ncbi:MAG: YkgJ family cysteine cluster protein [Myxococcota bacterium]|jgi:Fe-S-cluster containining protein